MCIACGNLQNTLLLPFLGSNLAVDFPAPAPDIAEASAGQGVAVSALAASAGEGAAAPLAAPQTITGTSGNDQLNGGTDADTINGGAGNDALHGMGGDDSLAGGDGDDALYGYDGNDTLIGGVGNDTLGGGTGNDSLDGGDGGDALYGNEAGNDTLIGGAGNDSLYGGVGQDLLDGGDGNDYLSTYGTTGNHTLLGGAGTDNLFGGDGTDSLDGGAGNDMLNGGGGDDSLVGGDGSDILYGNEAGNDTLIGGAGNDSLYGGVGNDLLDGGAGDDYLSTYGTVSNATLIGGIGNDSLYSGDSADSLDGGDGNDGVYGYAGNDTLIGGAGNDTLDGGAGNDSLLGGDGTDTLYGNDGDDTLIGGAGADSLYGGDGNDIYYIDDLTDYIWDTDGSSDTAIVSVRGYIPDSSIENIRYVGDGSAAPYFIQSLVQNYSHMARDSADKTVVTFGWRTDLSALSSGDSNPRVFNAGEKAQAREAFALWAAVANVSFVETATAPDIQFAAATLPSGVAGHATLGTGNGSVWMASGGVSLTTFIHEIGHTLGFKHPGNYNAGGGGAPPPYLPTVEDSRNNTQMSYTFTSNTGLGVYDIAAIQYIYGPNKDVRNGADTYILSSTEVGRYIWDGGGNDTVSASGAAQAVTIDLRDGGWGWFGSQKDLFLSEGQFFIGYGTVIENAIGGNGNDLLTGNAADNSLTGGAGSDSLVGGAGTDTAIFTGTYASYAIALSGSDLRVTSSQGEVDSLSGIEWLKFDDRTVAAPTATPGTPYLSASAQPVQEGAAGATTQLVYTITLSAAASSAVSFNVRSNGGTATAGTDYTAIDRTVTIAAGATTATVAVEVRGDALVEKDETVQLVISNLQGARLLDDSSSLTVTGTILNDDLATDPIFSLSAYRALNPDLVVAFGDNALAITWHYVNYGKAEGRAATGFDVETYAALNPDLFNAFGLNAAALTSHYLRFGKAEGRVTSGFDVDAYAALNPDLFNAFGTDPAALIRHYINNGQAEGRTIIGFDVEAYAALNPDLYRAFGLDEAALIRHYITNGKAEGRQTTGFDAEAYAVLNPDLLSAFGLNHAALINHYQYAGRAEGRAAYLPAESASLGLLAMGSDMPGDALI